MKADSNMEGLGFDGWFQDHVERASMEGSTPARVTAVHKESYIISNGAYNAVAELVGKLAYGVQSSLDYPAVGDWVLAKFYDKNAFAIIHQVLPRKSVLKRKTAGKKIDFQLIAANIDTAFVVQSLDDNFNLRRLERYLVMVNQGNIRPVVLLSKSDLVEEKEIAARMTEIKNIMPALEILSFSNMAQSGLECIKQRLEGGKTYCLLGSSGVGKTTLINSLVGTPMLSVKSVRAKDGKGRHTTTSRQLIWLENKAMIIDTPGMRELGNFSVPSGLQKTFAEISLLADACRFADCTHVSENGCAVLQAVEDGHIDRKRYLNYLRMNRESEYAEMSYHEKRKKDKALGKFYKSVLQQKKNRR